MIAFARSSKSRYDSSTVNPGVTLTKLTELAGGRDAYGSTGTNYFMNFPYNAAAKLETPIAPRIHQRKFSRTRILVS